MTLPTEGLLGKADIPATANTDIYTVPAGVWVTVNIYLANRTTGAIVVRIAIRTGALANSDYLAYDVEIPAHGILRETGVPCLAGETVTIYTSAAGVSACVRGFEEVAP